MIRLCSCVTCTHLHPVRFGKRYTCDAFPAGVLDDILFGRNSHTQPYPGDNGIQFEDKGFAPPTQSELQELLDQNDEELVPYVLRVAANRVNETINREWAKELILKYENHPNELVRREAAEGKRKLFGYRVDL